MAVKKSFLEKVGLGVSPVSESNARKDDNTSKGKGEEFFTKPNPVAKNSEFSAAEMLKVYQSMLNESSDAAEKGILQQKISELEEKAKAEQKAATSAEIEKKAKQRLAEEAKERARLEKAAAEKAKKRRTLEDGLSEAYDLLEEASHDEEYATGVVTLMAKTPEGKAAILSIAGKLSGEEG